MCLVSDLACPLDYQRHQLDDVVQAPCFHYTASEEASCRRHLDRDHLVADFLVFLQAHVHSSFFGLHRTHHCLASLAFAPVSQLFKMGTTGIGSESSSLTYASLAQHHCLHARSSQLFAPQPHVSPDFCLPIPLDSSHLLVRDHLYLSSTARPH